MNHQFRKENQNRFYKRPNRRDSAEGENPQSASYDNYDNIDEREKNHQSASYDYIL